MTVLRVQVRVRDTYQRSEHTTPWLCDPHTPDYHNATHRSGTEQGSEQSIGPVITMSQPFIFRSEGHILRLDFPRSQHKVKSGATGINLACKWVRHGSVACLWSDRNPLENTPSSDPMETVEWAPGNYVDGSASIHLFEPASPYPPSPFVQSDADSIWYDDEEAE